MRAAAAAARLLPGVVLLAAAPGLLASAPAPGHPPDPRPEAYYLYSLAQQSLLRRDYRSALEQMERAAARDASPSLLLELAQLRYSLNDVDGAAALAEGVLARGADDPDLRKLLGDVYLSRAREGIEPETHVERAIESYAAALRQRPQDLDACRALAELYYHTGRLDEARQVLRTFSRTRTLEPPLALLLGKTELRSGRLAEAEEILADLAARTPGNLEVADALAVLYEQQEKYDEAIAVYRMLLGQGGGQAAYLHDRIGSLHLIAGRYQDAVRELEQARRLDPDDVRGLLALAQAYEGAGDAAAALERYDRALRLDAGSLEARFHRARLLHRQGDYEAARRAYGALLETAAVRGPVTERDAIVLALTYTQIGLLEMNGRRHAEAARAFEAALNAAEEPDPGLFLLLARAHLEGGDHRETERVMAEAERRHPADLELKVFRGEMLLARQHAAEARALYDGLLREKGRTAEVYGRIGEALLRRKRYDLAETVLVEAVKRHPTDDGLWFARGAAAERLGRTREAERLLARAIRLNPNNAMALNYLGYMLADRGERLEEALDLVRRALEIDPGNPAYLDSLAWAQFRQGRHAESEANLRSALRRDESDPTIREHLGDVLMVTGRADEAVREWQAALEHGHEDPDRVRAKIERARVGRQGPP
jgi:tetratricopeptide (TPR) repeat protein